MTTPDNDAPPWAGLVLTDLGALAEAAECLRTLAHPHRLRMVQMLLQDRFTVGELAEACGLPSPMASEHLRLMQRSGFLTSERDGRRVYYQVAEPHLAKILNCIEGRFGVSSTETPSLPSTGSTDDTATDGSDPAESS